MDFPDTIRLHHATRAKAIKLDAMLKAEYPGLALTYDAGPDELRVESWIVVGGDDENIYEGPKVPELADLLETCADMGIDPEQGPEGEEEDEKPEPSGSVVPENYRATYREVSSNGQTCGDWLAETLVNETHGVQGFHVEDFDAILTANAVDFTGAWARLPTSGQKGWVGRYRMNGRQVLEKAVALSGVYRSITGSTVLPPEAFMDTLRAKHAKWLAKEEKRAAKERAEALKGAVETSEGEKGAWTQTNEGPVWTPNHSPANDPQYADDDTQA